MKSIGFTLQRARQPWNSASESESTKMCPKYMPLVVTYRWFYGCKLSEHSFLADRINNNRFRVRHENEADANFLRGLPKHGAVKTGQ